MELLHNKCKEREFLGDYMGLYGFEDRLSEARRIKKFTQEELATRLGVTPQAISKWERGLSLPDLDLLNNLCTILNCSSDYLIGTNSQEEKITETDDFAEKKRIFDAIYAEPLELLIGSGLIPLILEEQEQNHYKGLQLLRETLAYQYGWLVPPLHIMDDKTLKEFEFRIISYDRLLANEIFASEDENKIEYIYDTLKDAVYQNYHTIINRQIVKLLVGNISDRFPAVIHNVVPDKLSYAFLQKVLCRIVEKKKTIHNIIKIIELLDEEYNNESNEIMLADLIMSKLT